VEWEHASESIRIEVDGVSGHYEPFAANHVCDRCGHRVVTSAPTKTSGRSASVRPSRMDARRVTGLLHK
jgi:hypothetical protein